MYTSEINKKHNHFLETLNNNSTTLWKTNYTITTQFEEQKEYDTKKYQISCTCLLHFFKYKETRYGLHIEKKDWKKEKGESLSVLEELQLVLGKHSDTIIYLYDKSFQLESILNFENLQEKWEIDKHYAVESFSGKPATIFIEKTNDVVNDQSVYLKQKIKSFPDGLLLQIAPLFFDKIKQSSICINSFSDPLGSFIVQKKVKETEEIDIWEAKNSIFLEKEEVLKILNLAVYSLENETQNVAIDQQASILIETKNKTWEKVTAFFSIVQGKVYKKTINFTMTKTNF